MDDTTAWEAVQYVADALEDAGHEVGFRWSDDGDEAYVEVTIHEQEFVLRLTQKSE
jgi:hypothetical protein